MSGSNLTVFMKSEALLLVMLCMMQVSVLDSEQCHNQCHVVIIVLFKVNYIQRFRILLLLLIIIITYITQILSNACIQ